MSQCIVKKCFSFFTFKYLQIICKVGNSNFNNKIINIYIKQILNMYRCKLQKYCLKERLITTVNVKRRNIYTFLLFKSSYVGTLVHSLTDEYFGRSTWLQFNIIFTTKIKLIYEETGTFWRLHQNLTNWNVELLDAIPTLFFFTIDP